MNTALQNKVIVVWREGANDPKVHTLWYRPEGKIRTYSPNSIDPRAGNPQLYLTRESVVGALVGATDHTKSIAVPVPIAISVFGWKEEEFYSE